MSDDGRNMFGVRMGPQGRAGYDPKTSEGPPFKPFTVAEVCAITGIEPKVLDAWTQNVLPVQRGEEDQSVTGLDYMQTFGVYAGKRWLDEGAGLERATRVMAFCAGSTLNHLLKEFEAGNTWPPHVRDMPKLVTRPPRQKAGKTCNLKTLHGEFVNLVRKVFPNG